MTRKPVPRRVLSLLVALAVVLLVSLGVLLSLGRVVGEMGDATGQCVLDRIALGVGILWAIDAICLVLALGVNSLTNPDNGPPGGPPDKPQ